MAAGTEVRLLLLLLLLTRQIFSQHPITTTALPETTTALPETTTGLPETTTGLPETTTALPETTTDPPSTSSGQQWTRLEDGSIELDGFTGSTIPAPDLQEARHLRIVNSNVQTITEGIFPVDVNITDATLEIINTTIHQWNANTMDSFANVTITNSRIRQLNSSGIRSTLKSDNRCDANQDYDIVVLFNSTTIEKLHAAGLDLGPVRALLQLTGCSIVELHGQALRLGLGVTLRVEDTEITALTPTSLSGVCSLEVHFQRNQLLHVPAHALHFGSPQCKPQTDDIECRREGVQQRRVAISGTSLPCGPLGWLRHALHRYGILTDDTEHDYSDFVDTSDCSDRPESVHSFLLREPESVPEPEPDAIWWHSPPAAAGIAVALAIGFLLVGLLTGCFLGGTRCTAGRHSFQRAVSRRVHNLMSDGDAGITLPLGRMGKTAGTDETDGTDADPRRRESDGRYGAGPVRPGSPGRPRATTLETTPQQERERLPAPLPQKTTHRSPRPPRPPGHKRPKRDKRQPAAGPQNQNQWPQQPGATADGQQIYENQWPPQAGVTADGQQIYENQWPPPQPSGHGTEQESLYQNQPPNPQHPEDQIYVNPQWPEAPANHSTGIYENLHKS